MYILLLCQRYLQTRFIALASIVSVMLGVATMIVVNSVMSGFSTQMKDRIHTLLADVVIETHSMDGVEDAELQIDLARAVVGDQIQAITPSIEVFGLMSFNYGGQFVTQPITLVGIDPVGKSKIGPLREFLDSYNPISRDGKIVRKALRESSEDPGWELTQDALEYRKTQAELQKWYSQQQELSKELEQPSSVVATPSTVVSAEPQPVPSKDQVVADNPFLQEIETANTEKSATDKNPFIPDVNPDQIKDVDPAELMEGRLYVGAGLISFPYKDPETGETKIQMMARPGDDIKVSTVLAGRRPEPTYFSATIVDVFKSGMSEYDSQLIFCDLKTLQKARGMIVPETGKGAITTLQIKLKDYNQAPIVVDRLRAAFPASSFQVRTWEQKQGPLLAAVEVESAILNVLLFLIIAVAGFGILAIFCMIVVEKTRDIGILMALGASSRGVMSIFLSYGLALGVVGSGMGVVMGLLFVKYINEVEAGITWITGRKVFDETIYYFPEIPTMVSPMMVMWVAFGAMVIAVLASVIPARRAAAMNPVDALRLNG